MRKLITPTKLRMERTQLSIKSHQISLGSKSRDKTNSLKLGRGLTWFDPIRIQSFKFPCNSFQLAFGPSSKSPFKISRKQLGDLLGCQLPRIARGSENYKFVLAG